MRGLEKNCTRWRRTTDTHLHGHGDSMTNSAQWGRVGENMTKTTWTFLQGLIEHRVAMSMCVCVCLRHWVQFSPTRPHWAELVIESPCPFVCLSVCLCHRKTPTSGGRVDLWSKIAFLILVWDDTIFKKRGGSNFFSKIVKNC